jgi:hypothetical protein
MPELTPIQAGSILPGRREHPGQSEAGADRPVRLLREECDTSALMSQEGSHAMAQEVVDLPAHPLHTDRARFLRHATAFEARVTLWCPLG